MNNLTFPVDGPSTNSSGNITFWLGLTDSVGGCEALCVSQADCHSYTCSLNRVCNDRGHCDCDPAWSGPTCRLARRCRTQRDL